METVKQIRIWAYGDSFVAGDQDIPGRVDAIEEHTHYNRYNVSFVSQLAKKLNVELINRGISGCSNLVQLDKLFLDAPNIKSNDIVIFGLTTAWRDRFTIPYVGKEYLKDTRGPSLIHRELVSKEHRLEKVATIDLFYVLSVIEKIEEIFNIKIVKFNLFHDSIAESTEQDKQIFKFKNFIGLENDGNTLLDVLTNNWGNKISRISDHSKWKPPVEYKHLFTAKSHPNLEGHKKIADWLEVELKKLKII
jgi:hypothetical protein